MFFPSSEAAFLSQVFGSVHHWFLMPPVHKLEITIPVAPASCVLPSSRLFEGVRIQQSFLITTCWSMLASAVDSTTFPSMKKKIVSIRLRKRASWRSMMPIGASRIFAGLRDLHFDKIQVFVSRLNCHSVKEPHREGTVNLMKQRFYFRSSRITLTQKT